MKMNTASSSGSGTLPSNTITNPKEDLKGITTQSGTAYQGPTIPTTSSSLPQVAKRETEVTKDIVPPTNNGSTKDVQPLVVQVETPISNPEPVVASVIEPLLLPLVLQILTRNRQYHIPLKAEMGEINKNLMRVLQVNQQVKAVTPNCETCGGPHSYNDCLATVGQTQNVYAAGAYQGKRCHSQNMQTNMTSLTNSNLELENMFGEFMKMDTASSSGSGTLPSNTITNSKEDLKVERETEVTKDIVPLTNNGSTKDFQPSVVQDETSIQNSKPVVAPIIEPVVAPVSAPKPNQKPLIPYPSRLHDQKLRDKANDQKEKFFQIFKDLDFKISFADAPILMPKFGPTIKTLLTNKDKLFELARTPLNEHCSAVLLKKLPKTRGPRQVSHPVLFYRDG
nr:reverse transcriptase domain-containing protein [Tanacetum cinerariifolium]